MLGGKDIGLPAPPIMPGMGMGMLRPSAFRISFTPPVAAAAGLALPLLDASEALLGGAFELEVVIFPLGDSTGSGAAVAAGTTEDIGDFAVAAGDEAVTSLTVGTSDSTCAGACVCGCFCGGLHVFTGETGAPAAAAAEGGGGGGGGGTEVPPVTPLLKGEFAPRLSLPVVPVVPVLAVLPGAVAALAAGGVAVLLNGELPRFSLPGVTELELVGTDAGAAFVALVVTAGDALTTGTDAVAEAEAGAGAGVG